MIVMIISSRLIIAWEVAAVREIRKKQIQTPAKACALHVQYTYIYIYIYVYIYIYIYMCIHI